MWTATKQYDRDAPTPKDHAMRLPSILFSVTCTAWMLVASAPTAVAVDILATAIPGSPFGVATVEIPLPVPVVGEPLPPLTVDEASGRVFYPIAEDTRVDTAVRPSDRPLPPQGRGRLLGRLGNLIREIASDEEPLQQTVARRVTFLFKGDGPLVITLADSRGSIGTYDIVPTPDPATHAAMLNQWWSVYTDAAKRQIDSADYPTYVEDYLVAMLAGRLNLPLPDWYLAEDDSEAALTDTLKLIGGATDVAQRIYREAAAGMRDTTGGEDQTLPAPPAWLPPNVPPGTDDVPTEPIADRVPPECFYIRYGSFANYLWFRDLSEEYGGDLSRMITLSGIQQLGSLQLEKQLHLQTNELSRMLGPTVIKDQALVGRDLFLGDGATMGVLFEPVNAFLLRTSINQDRTSLAASDDAVTLTDVDIAGQKATVLRSADNQIRSFMVEFDGYIFVTNSETLARRFVEVGKSGDSLAQTPSFRFARQLMPLTRNDTIFAYFSPAMLQGLVAPDNMIELRRRMHAESDIALVHVARLAAAAEGSPARSIAQLTDAGYLPAGFSKRADGSSVFEIGDDIMDTRRGARGYFLPIADASVDKVTAEEARWYERIADDYSTRFRQLDPIMAGIQRTKLEDGSGNERLTAHVEIAPWSPEKYGTIAQQLGPPTNVAMDFAPDDIVAVQAHVASELLGPPTHLFVGIKDSIPPQPDDFDGLIATYRALKSLPAYLGAWPQPGALDRLPLGLGRGVPVSPGMSRLIGGVYRYTGGGFSVLSFYPDLLQASLPHMGAIEVDDRAQVRAHIGDLSESLLKHWVNDQLYQRAAVGSQSGANFLNLLSRQLRVAPEQAKPSAELILGGPLQCPLGGRYEHSPTHHQWVSTRWSNRSAADTMPDDYVAPIMQWFRGADAKLTQYDDRVVVDAVVDVARQ
ncbi:hypothetical protein [Crateriforma conspicua]|uniref:Uncharacterized protein n=1 Tax=Crateriforma conspicua TaxID=2527996 RepID=A0A5C5XRJ7_9PLAN|nr:hypothetical protein [Crateriforma conspicua]TWT65514.1 hypothetical protein Pan14r_50600 [Crateriforma conspicua]